jgi:alginate O-acetyltransferase complex protein AlgI
MLFSSLLFLTAFLPLALFCYYLTPSRFRNFTLLTCSLIFYAWGELRWFPILLGSVAFNFTAGLALQNQRWKKTVLSGSVAANLALLGYFKYAGFFAENLTLFGHWSGMAGFNSVARVSLPVGISFYTFQCISYACLTGTASGSGGDRDPCTGPDSAA